MTSISRWLARRRPVAQTNPRVSVVMPVYNAEHTLAECLARLFQSTWEDFEVILVDDGSTDGTRAIAANFPVRIVPTKGRVGPAAARNLGARVAEGDILFFIDSDVMVRPDSIDRLVRRFGEGDVDAVCGVQAADMRYRDLVSQYKNLWMRWTYLRQQGEVPLFYTTAAAIRREVFLHAGGFDAGYATPNVEDTAFGQKLQRLGIRVKVQADLEVEHVKHYSLVGLLRTDFMRAVSLARLKLRHREDLTSNNSSVPVGYMASMPLAGLATVAPIAGLALELPVLAVVGLAAAFGVLVLNREFLDTIRTNEGWGKAAAAVPLLWLELLVAGVGGAVGVVSYPFGVRY